MTSSGWVAYREEVVFGFVHGEDRTGGLPEEWTPFRCWQMRGAGTGDIMHSPARLFVNRHETQGIFPLTRAKIRLFLAYFQRFCGAEKRSDYIGFQKKKAIFHGL
jgi:hypothetical protein